MEATACKTITRALLQDGRGQLPKDIIQSKANLAKLEDINGKLIQDLDWLKKLLQLQSEHLEVCYGARQSTYLITSSMWVAWHYKVRLLLSPAPN